LSQGAIVTGAARAPRLRQANRCIAFSAADDRM